jgi:hypothetical protein
MTLNNFPVTPDKFTLRRRRLVVAVALALVCSSFAGLSAMKNSNTSATAQTNAQQPQISVPVQATAPMPQMPATQPLQGAAVQRANAGIINSASIYNAGYRDGYNRAQTQAQAQNQGQNRPQPQAQGQTQSLNRPLTAVHPHAVQPVRDSRTFFQKHPMVKGAAIGAGIGGGAGALTGLVTGQGVFRGAAIGATTGAGVGVVRTSKIMKRHPIARDIATGGLTGLGLGWAGSHYPHTIAATTGVGAAIGLGAGLFNNLR